MQQGINVQRKITLSALASEPGTYAVVLRRCLKQGMCNSFPVKSDQELIKKGTAMSMLNCMTDAVTEVAKT